jgi:electron transfer flavoprotein beta subunit
MKSKTAEIPVWSAEDIGAEGNMAGISGSPTRVVKIFFPKREQKSEIMQGSLDEQLDQLMEKLEEIV